MYKHPNSQKLTQCAHIRRGILEKLFFYEGLYSQKKIKH